MSRVVRFYEQGPAEVLKIEEAEIGPPKKAEVRIRHTAIGVNFHDIYNRSGLYPVASLPEVPGIEAAGVIEQLGDGIEHLEVGDRVVYINPPEGSYRDETNLPAKWLVKIPEAVTDVQAAGSFLRGITAEILVNRIRAPEPGSKVLIQAVSGGVGLILCQWLKAIGCYVIGTTSNEEKAALARANGCDQVIIYTKENFVDKTREITAGQGVPIAYDAVGKDTFIGSLDCLSKRGMLINYGQSSGAPDPLPMMELARRGSLAVTRPFIWDFFQSQAQFEQITDNFFDMIKQGKINIHIHPPYALSDVVQAHKDFESRKTTGGVVLIP